MEIKNTYYEIYQVKAKEKFAFMDWERIENFNLDWSFKPYKRVWAGFEDTKDDYNLLERLFVKFNVNHPIGFKGHSMSVSDIVKINHTVNEDEAKYYYCDSFGWKDITKEIKED